MERAVCMEKSIEVQGLIKRYGAVEAVRGIDFYVEKGKLFAFLGPNGAGKSTTINVLCTLLAPDQGGVLIGGHRLGGANQAIRSKIGVVFQEGVLDPLLTVRENLYSRAKLYGYEKGARRKAVEDAARAADVVAFIDRPYGKLSGGQRRRADIARALVHTPEILFLDEPTTGLDPQTRRNVWDMVATIQREKGMTVFFSTHYMEEAARSDYIIIIDHGKIAARGTPQALKEAHTADVVRMQPRDREALAAVLHGKGYAVTEREGCLTVTVKGMEEALSLLNGAAPLMEDFEVVHGTLDDVFISITGAEVRDNA